MLVQCLLRCTSIEPAVDRHDRAVMPGITSGISMENGATTCSQSASQKTQEIAQCCFNVYDAGYTLKQHWANFSCLPVLFDLDSCAVYIVSCVRLRLVSQIS